MRVHEMRIEGLRGSTNTRFSGPAYQKLDLENGRWSEAKSRKTPIWPIIPRYAGPLNSQLNSRAQPKYKAQLEFWWTRIACQMILNSPEFLSFWPGFRDMALRALISVGGLCVIVHMSECTPTASHHFDARQRHPHECIGGYH